MRLIIMGPAGAGKGTLAQEIIKRYHLAYIATGSMFRQEISQKSELGLLAKTYIDSGKLVPDDVTIALVLQRIKGEDCKLGFILDGFPRTINQARALEETLVAQNLSIEQVISLNIDFEELKKRIVDRRICSGCQRIYNLNYLPPKETNICDDCGSDLYQRSDDTLDQLSIRIQEYEENTKEVLEFYQKAGKVIDIDASLPPHEVWLETAEKLVN